MITGDLREIASCTYKVAVTWPWIGLVPLVRTSSLLPLQSGSIGTDYSCWLELGWYLVVTSKLFFILLTKLMNQTLLYQPRCHHSMLDSIMSLYCQPLTSIPGLYCHHTRFHHWYCSTSHMFCYHSIILVTLNTPSICQCLLSFHFRMDCLNYTEIYLLWS